MIKRGLSHTNNQPFIRPKTAYSLTKQNQPSKTGMERATSMGLHN